MSKLKISENLFLETNELNRLINFLEDDGYKRIFKAIVKSYGIVENSSNGNFKATLKTGTTNTVVVNSGLAFDSNLNAIVMDDPKEFIINNTGTKRWLVLSRSVKNTEIGTVSITADGTLTGIGTEFTKILRGQPNFPVKVKFKSARNSGEYEVVNVLSDSSAILSGDFVSESDINFSVIGTFTPGFQPLDSNKEIYEYDSYNISILDSDDTPVIFSNQFILASLEFDASGVLSVFDERIKYMFNNPYTQRGNGASQTGINPLVSLLGVSAIGGINSLHTISADFELIIEHGYNVIAHKLNVTANDNIFNIISGDCNFLGSGNIPDGMFRGWLLLNRKNMKYAVIDNNVNKAVYISNLDTSMIENTNDFVIVPDFSEIEYEISISSNVDSPSIPFYFKKSIWNSKSRLRVYAYMPSISASYADVITVTLKYRMIDDKKSKHPFTNLAIAQFTNTKGISEILSNSSFNINLSEIEPK